MMRYLGVIRTTMELTHVGPKDVARKAELRWPSGVVCSDLVGPPLHHPNSCMNSFATALQLSRRADSTIISWPESEIQTTRNGSLTPNAPPTFAASTPRTIELSKAFACATSNSSI